MKNQNYFGFSFTLLHKFPFRIINVSSYTRHSLKQTFIKINRSKGSECLCLANSRLSLFLWPWVMWLIVYQKGAQKEDSEEPTERRKQSHYSAFSIRCSHICLHGLYSTGKVFVLPPLFYVAWLWAAGRAEGFLFSLFPVRHRNWNQSCETDI